MKQIHMSGDQFFVEILKNYEARMISGEKNVAGETPPHRHIRSVDYVIKHTLTPSNPLSQKSVFSRKGWYFVATGIIADYDNTFNKFVPSIKIKQDDVAGGNLSGSSYGSPAQPISDFGFESVQNCFGRGANNQFMSEPRDFLRHFGDNGIIDTQAKLATGDTLTRHVNIIVTGWEVKV